MSEYKLSSDKIQNILITMLAYLEQIIEHDQGCATQTINGEHLRLTIDIFKNKRGDRTNDRLHVSQYQIEEAKKGELTVNELPDGVEPLMMKAYYAPDKNTIQTPFNDISKKITESRNMELRDIFENMYDHDLANPVVDDLKSYRESINEALGVFKYILTLEDPYNFTEHERIRYNNLIKSIRDYKGDK